MIGEIRNDFLYNLPGVINSKVSVFVNKRSPFGSAKDMDHGDPFLSPNGFPCFYSLKNRKGN